MIISTTSGRRGLSRPAPARRRVDRPRSLDLATTEGGSCLLDWIACPGTATSPLELAETLADLVAPLTAPQRNAVCRVILDGDELADLAPVDRRCYAAALARLRDLHGATAGEAR